MKTLIALAVLALFVLVATPAAEAQCCGSSTMVYSVPHTAYYSPPASAVYYATPHVTYYAPHTTYYAPAVPYTSYYAPAAVVRPGLFGWRWRAARRRAYWGGYATIQPY